MLPTLKPNQEILVSSIPYFFNKPKAGDLIAFKDKHEFIVKRVKKIAGHKLLVTGDNLADSKDFGWIKREEVIGKVIYVLT